MKPLGPYALSGVNPQPFNVEWDNVAQPPIGVDIQNQSSLLLQLQIAGQSLWLTPWTARYFPVPSAATYVAVTPSIEEPPTSADPLTVTGTLYQVGDTPPIIVERALTGLAVASAISGIAQVAGSQVSLVNSPFTFTASPQTETFPLPVNCPPIAGLLIVPFPSMGGYTPGAITVKGHDTGTTYFDPFPLNKKPLICDFSSIADPDGVDITWQHFGGAGTSSRISVVGLQDSQVTKPVHGAQAEGPTLWKSGGTGAGAFTLFQVPNNGQYRVWSAWVNDFGGSGNCRTVITDGINSIIESPNVKGDSLTFEGGLPIGALVTLQVVSSGGVSPLGFGGVAYSIDAP